MHRKCLAMLVLLGWLGQVATLAAQGTEILDLQGKWEFREYHGNDWLPAQVPGTVHTDLFAAKLIPDPYMGVNESQLQWIEQLDWEYRKHFRLTEQQLLHARADLVFDGLDTYVEVHLNGQLLLRCDNMHRRWVIPCKPYLHTGENELLLHFISPMQAALPAYQASPFPLPADNDAAEKKLSPYVRKAAYQFGWDFGPRFVTAGVWRPVHLRLWDMAHVDRLHAHPLSLGADEAQMHCTLDLDVANPGLYEIDLMVDDAPLLSINREFTSGKQRVEVQFSIQNPQFWWPRGMGTAKRYALKAVLRRGQAIVGEAQQHIGLRSIQLIRHPDPTGTSFYFIVNGFLPIGGPLYIKGANHIPTDAFLPRGHLRQQQLLEAAEAVGMNMVRVWGGGVYADDAFYEWCDTHGMLVWQDLPFACMMYPLEGAFLDNALKEVEDNVLRLRSHPSLALWCGNNEIEVAWHNWGWQEKGGYAAPFSQKLWEQYQQFFHSRIPNLLAGLDPDRPWIPTSPLSNWGQAEGFNHHNMHYWGVWHGTDSLDGFSRHVPRFMSEYGFQSWPASATLQRYIAPQDWAMDSKAVLNRQKSYKGNAPILRFLLPRYGQPKDFSTFIRLSQFLQRDAMTLAIEAHRLHTPHCMGTLYWQLGDCWPGASWSTIDYEGVWKPAHYALQRLYAPVLLCADLRDDSVHIQVVSELPEKLANVQVRLKSFDGVVIADHESAITLHTGSFHYLSLPVSALSSHIDPRRSLIEVVLHKGREVLADDLVYFTSPKDLDLPDPDFKYQVKEAGTHFLLELQASTLVKDMEIHVADAQAQFSDNFFDLVPGRPRTISITTPSVTRAPELLERLRFRDLSRMLP